MLDSLNLDDLQRQAERLSRFVIVSRLEPWIDNGFGLLIAAVIFLGMHWFENATQFAIVLFALAMPSTVLRLVIVLQVGIGGVQRVNRYKPDFVQRARWNELIAFLFITAYSLACLFAFFYALYDNLLNALLPFTLLMLPPIIGWAFGRFYGWLRKIYLKA